MIIHMCRKVVNGKFVKDERFTGWCPRCELEELENEEIEK